MSNKSKEELLGQLAIVRKENPTWGATKIGRALGVNRNKAAWLLRAAEGLEDSVPPAERSDQEDGTKMVVSSDGKNKTLTTVSANIKTLEEALEYSKIDLTRYEVDRFIINSWEVTMGAQSSGEPVPKTFTNYQVKVWLKPKTHATLGLEALLERLADVRPLPAIKRRAPSKKPPVMVEMGLYDHHFGMLAWHAETGQSYDSEIAAGIYNSAVDYALNNLAQHDVDKFVIPIGNDLFHINDDNAETPTNRNRLDVDTRLAKVFEIAQEAVLRAVERCLQVAPVDVLWIPGNHDPQMSFAMCHFLRGVFRGSQHCNVDVTPNHRKYVRYGNLLLGLTHGTYEKPERLPLLMLEDRQRDMAETRFHEYHIGHKHNRNTWVFKSEAQGHVAMVRMLPSLCPHDKYHHEKGFNKSGKAAEFHMFSREWGHHGFLTVPVERLQ